MRTQGKIGAKKALAGLPAALRRSLLTAFDKIVSNFHQGRWEPAELNGGKLCEVVYSILRGYIDGRFPRRAYKPQNIVDACRQLERSSSSQFPRSIRIQIPRLLVALYEIRNSRNVGHVGGDVDPNRMDALAVLSMSKWIVAELVRVFHGVNTETASAIVDALVERHIPVVWRVGGKLRVLDPKLTKKKQTLLLLYACPDGVSASDLISWTEHSNASAYRRDVLKELHQSRLVEYDQVSGLVRLSPTGARYVEAKLPLEMLVGEESD